MNNKEEQKRKFDKTFGLFSNITNIDDIFNKSIKELNEKGLFSTGTEIPKSFFEMIHYPDDTVVDSFFDIFNNYGFTFNSPELLDLYWVNGFLTI